VAGGNGGREVRGAGLHAPRRVPVRSRARPGRVVGRPAAGQHGFGLAEVLICLVLIATLSVALIAGLLTQIRASDTTSRRQEVDLVLAHYAEHVRSLDYDGCGIPGDGGYTAPDGMTAQIVEVEHWRKATGQFAASCALDGDGQPIDDGAVRLTLRVEYGSLGAETQVVKVR